MDFLSGRHLVKRDTCGSGAVFRPLRGGELLGLVLQVEDRLTNREHALVDKVVRQSWYLLRVQVGSSPDTRPVEWSFYATSSRLVVAS